MVNRNGLAALALGSALSISALENQEARAQTSATAETKPVINDIQARALAVAGFFSHTVNAQEGCEAKKAELRGDGNYEEVSAFPRATVNPDQEGMSPNFREGVSAFFKIRVYEEEVAPGKVPECLKAVWTKIADNTRGEGLYIWQYNNRDVSSGGDEPFFYLDVGQDPIDPRRWHGVVKRLAHHGDKSIRPQTSNEEARAGAIAVRIGHDMWSTKRECESFLPMINYDNHIGRQLNGTEPNQSTASPSPISGRETIVHIQTLAPENLDRTPPCISEGWTSAVEDDTWLTALNTQLDSAGNAHPIFSIANYTPTRGLNWYVVVEENSQ